MKKHIPIMWLFAGLICLPSALLSAADMTWDMPNEYPATSVGGEGDIYFGERLRETSKGKIEIPHHFGGSLGFKSKDQQELEKQKL